MNDARFTECQIAHGYYSKMKDGDITLSHHMNTTLAGNGLPIWFGKVTLLEKSYATLVNITYWKSSEPEKKFILADTADKIYPLWR